MKNSFNNLSLKNKKIFAISLSIFSLILIFCGSITQIFSLAIIGFIILTPSIFLLNFVEKKEKDVKAIQIEQDKINTYEMQKYRELLSNDLVLNNIQSNFECSILNMIFTQIKENQFYSPNDLNFNIDDRINKLNEMGKSFFIKSKYNSFIAIDLETTGLSPESDRIIQIALVKVINGVVVDKFMSLVNPKTHISINASEVNGIYDDDVKNSKTMEELFPHVMEFMEKFPLVAHNAKFDIAFLKNEYLRCYKKSMPYKKSLCTMNLWKRLYKKFQNEDVSSSKLNTLVINLLNENEIAEYNANKHDAYCDALATAKVFMKLYDDKAEE